MTVRKGASLINIMVFVMFAMMVTAQVFFYTTTSFEGLTEEREIMSYRLMLDSIVRLASADLAENGKISHKVVDTEGNKVETNYTSFYDDTQVWNLSDYLGVSYPDKYHATIHDLDYELNTTTQPFSRATWESSKYNEKNMYQKIFATMPAISDDLGTERSVLRYYLLRAYFELPEDKFYGRKLMYQVLFRRSETDPIDTPHTVELKSFQEIWF